MTGKPPEDDLTERPDQRLKSPMEGAEAMALTGAREGETEAFRMLVDQHSHKMFRLAFRMTGNEQDAEDVVQETFLRAYRKLGRYESRAQLTSWLHTIATNCAIDLLRRRKRRPTTELERVELLSPMTSEEPGPERAAFSGQIQERVEAEMANLTPKERVAFTLRHYEGLSIDEIAEAMGSPSGSVKNNIFRAVRKLRAALSPMLGAQA